MVVIAPRHDGGDAALAALGRPECVDQGDHRGAYVKGARGSDPAEEGESQSVTDLYTKRIAIDAVFKRFNTCIGACPVV